MGNVSPRQSRSYRDGLNAHMSCSSSSSATVTGTPSRSSWKKQLQIINDTLNLKKFSLRHTNGRHKRYRTNFDENNHSKLASSVTTQNLHDLIKNSSEKTAKNERVETKLPQENHITKSFSLFSMKQPLTDITNKEIMTKSTNATINEKDELPPPSTLNSTNQKSNNVIAHKQQEKTTMKDNPAADASQQYKRRHKFETTTGEYAKCCSPSLDL